jgi:quinol monooxygenase YgiN
VNSLDVTKSAIMTTANGRSISVPCSRKISTGFARDQECKDAADKRHRNGAKNHRRLHRRTECDGKQDESGPSVFTQRGKDMYGLISKITAIPGKRDELSGVLLAGVDNMPGCLSYVIAKDNTDANGLWITEVWDSRASHEASLSLPSVKEAIAKGKPLIAGFSDRSATTPVGGHGLVLSNRR